MPLTFFSNFAARLGHCGDRKDRALIPPTNLPGPVAQLPSELVGLIISMVDSSMLEQCSLVSSVWMVYARSRIFYRISLSVKNENIERFLRLFDSIERFAIASSVREIVLDTDVVAYLDYTLWMPEFLPKLASKCHNLNTLTINRSLSDSFKLDSAFRIVTRLEMKLKAGSSLNAVTSFISTFLHLETLVVTLPHQSGSFHLLPATEGLLPHLRQVDLDNPLILGWIASSLPKPPLTAVRFRISQSASVPVTVEAMRSLSSLHSLDLTLFDLIAGAAFLRMNRLHLRSQLGKLRLRAPYTQAGKILLKILSEPSLDTSQLEEIWVDFQVSYVNRRVQIPAPWGSLNTMLSVLPRLHSLSMTVLIWDRYKGPSNVDEPRYFLLPGAANRLFSLSPDGVLATTVPEPRLQSRRAAGGGQPANYIYY
ncbi:hypothetical protein C8R43DRAFT_1127475 [Mycena crocata]|nr:hypothetical protein C8R43DRAFT_1127475 [Mycena crocata]